MILIPVIYQHSLKNFKWLFKKEIKKMRKTCPIQQSRNNDASWSAVPTDFPPGYPQDMCKTLLNT